MKTVSIALLAFACAAAQAEEPPYSAFIEPAPVADTEAPVTGYTMNYGTLDLDDFDSRRSVYSSAQSRTFEQNEAPSFGTGPHAAVLNAEQ